MKTAKSLVIGGLVLLMLTGCAYRYYLGLHGPSIRRFPNVHAEAAEDAQCLACHHPDRDPVGPPTSHPGFVGCLNCHDDPLP